MFVGPRVSYIVYDMFKLGMLFRLGIEGVRLTRKEMIIDKRWVVGVAIYCLMSVLNIITSSIIVTDLPSNKYSDGDGDASSYFQI